MTVLKFHSAAPLDGAGGHCRIRHFAAVGIFLIATAAHPTWSAPTNGSRRSAAASPPARAPVTAAMSPPVIQDDPMAPGGLVMAPPGNDMGCAACGMSGNAGCDFCGDGAASCRFTSLWGNVEYLLLWEQGGTLPPLVTTNSDPNIDRADAGVLGVPSTQILFGGERLDADNRNAGRVTVGMWWDRGARTGFGLSYLGMGKGTTRFDANASDFPILARPFIDANPIDVNSAPGENAQLLVFPGQFDGSVSIRTTSEMNSAEAFKRQLCYAGNNRRVDILVGYRYAQIKQDLTIANQLEFLVAQPPIGAGTTVQNHDAFATDNTYHAGQLGVWTQSRHGSFSLDLITKLAFGQMKQEATISGQTVSTIPGVITVTTEGGLLTQKSNIGTYKENTFALMPEVTLNLGYQLNPYTDFTLGYTFLYWSRIARPGDLIDRTVDLTQQVDSPTAIDRPRFTMRDTDYWLQGMTFGLNFRY